MNIMNIARSTIAFFLNTPAKHLANFVGIQDKRIDEMYIDLVNKIGEEDFKQVPTQERAILLPQCLRGEDCPAVKDEEGYHCKKCGACKIAEITQLAEELDYSVFIVPGGSMIPKLLRKHKPKGIIGVACFGELVMGVNLVRNAQLPVQAVPLSRGGCRNTDVDLYELKEVMTNTDEDE